MHQKLNYLGKTLSTVSGAYGGSIIWWGTAAAGGLVRTERKDACIRTELLNQCSVGQRK